MTKEQYIKDLKHGLRIYPTAFQEDILEAFEEHFNSGLAAGHTEEEIMETLGSVEEVLQNIQEMEETPVTLVNLNKKEETRQETSSSKDPFQDLADTITKAVKESLKGLDISIDEVVKDSLKVAKDVVKESKNRKDYRHDYYYDTDEFTYNDVNATECTSVNINLPFGDCDIEIFSGSKTEYYFETHRHLFTSNQSHISGRVEENTLYLEPASSIETRRSSFLSGKLFVTLSDTVEELYITTHSNDVDITDCHLDYAKITLTSGDLTIDGTYMHEGFLKTTSGDIELCNAKGTLDVSSTSGDIEAEDMHVDGFEAQSTSGNIDFEGLCNYISLKSTSGDIDVTFEDSIEHGNLQTTSGDIDINVDDTNYDMTIQTMSGDIHNHTRMRANKESHRVIRVGNGTIPITISTLSGDIAIW